MPLPTRSSDGDYHYHAYDFMNSVPFEPSSMQPKRGDKRFFSLLKDLIGLRDLGRKNAVPNINLQTTGKLIASSPMGDVYTIALSFGNLINDPQAPAVVITGGIHACEWIGSEFAYLLAEYLIINYNSEPRQKLDRYQRVIRDLVDSRRIHIIPMLNPLGNLYTVFGQDKGDPRLWRKNRRPLPATPADWENQLVRNGAANPPFQNVRRAPTGNQAQYDVPNYDRRIWISPGQATVYQTRLLPDGAMGVDPNRNLPTDAWGYDAPPHYVQWDPAGLAYFGPRACSELETANLAQYLFQKVGRCAVAIDYHSYAEAILYPGEQFNRGKVDPDHNKLGVTLQNLIKLPGAQGYQLGSPRTVIFYDATGTVEDYIAQRHLARSFTIELDPPFSEVDGFVLPEERIRTVFEKNIRGALAAIWVADGDPTVAGNLRTWNVSGRGNQLPR